MLICYGSDLHLEVEDQKLLPDVPDCDVFVLAGDVSKGLPAPYWANAATGDREIPTVYVPGNHEYYGWPKITLDEHYADFKSEHVALCNPGVLEVGDAVFIGCTLRSALSLPGHTPYPPEAFGRAIGDFHVSPGWDVYMHQAQHLYEVAFIEEMLHKYSDRKRVVVTHFVPTMQCIGPQFIGNSLNPYFVNDLDWLIEKHSPDAWIFGHTHNTFKKTHSNEKTKLLCNPRGYPSEKKRKYKWETFEL